LLGVKVHDAAVVVPEPQFAVPRRRDREIALGPETRSLTLIEPAPHTFLCLRCCLI
jgi:hypothetical protein